jgi:hypothetical protein
MSNDFKVACVIPLGPSGANWENPNIEYLEYGLKLLKEQLISTKIIIACDENIQTDRLDIVKKYAHDIRWFPPHSYFRPGGIWKKIWQCWIDNCKNIEFIKWQGYDDHVDKRSLIYQYQTLKKTGARSCFCSNFNNDHGNIRKVNNGNINFKQYIGNHPMYMGSFLMRKDAILRSGIGAYENKWAFYFEGLLYAFLCKVGKIVYNSNAMFYYRDHSGTISETCREKELWVQEARQASGYSLEQTKKDWESINFDKLCAEIRRNIR